MKTIVLIFSTLLLSLVGISQTFTTQNAGDWDSGSTWVGGVAPGSIIEAGVVVNVNHRVSFSLNSDFIISGTLNVSGDTLNFGSGYNKNILVNLYGLLKVINGGLLQGIQSASNDLIVDRGTVIINNSKVVISRDFKMFNGGTRSIKNSTVIIGRNYDLIGSAGFPAVDSIQFSVVETNILQVGELRIQDYSTLRLANAYIKILNGSKFKNEGGGAISTMAGANGNFAFDYLKVTGELQNDGTWNARIDATCISGLITGSQINGIDFTRSQDCSAIPLIGPAPELTFINPVLVAGTANQQGAVYRYANVTSGVDAQIRLKKFSRSDIVMQDIDIVNLGWNKAFQPQFGLPGSVAPNQNWYIDFEVKFYEAGTNTIKVMPKVDMTALDVDGNGATISEYASFQNPSSVSYSTLNFLTEQPSNLVGQLFTCTIDNIPSLLTSCTFCGGDGKTGIWNLNDCTLCDETGILHAGCNHAFEGVTSNTINGPIENYVDIDTGATQVMAVYRFTDRSSINFRYGAKSGSSGSTSGIRLNSLWFRQFSLTPVIFINLPVKLNSFTATLATTTKVELKWVTSSEINLSHFVVERSIDGVNYTDAGIAFAYGNTSDLTNYSLPDNITGIQARIIYYRLRSIDIDGNSKLSETRIIRIGKPNENNISIVAYPNPVSNEVRITIPTGWQNKKVIYELFNLNGQVITTKQTTSSTQTETLDVTSLAPGTYFVRVNCEGLTAQQKLIKQ